MIGPDLVAAGRALRLETSGAVSGRSTGVTLGFVREDDGSLLVAAGDPDARWAADLDADPACRVTIGDQVGAYEAELLEGRDAAHAVRELILRGRDARRAARAGPGLPPSAGSDGGRPID
ncbi:MAG TPA: nitroreductase/quinone reductase family protein [Candidatus Limnocylindrales bacterium]|nr:nitroreductase/quinone reductase family protein [Candidatus Limnocylindrales bacterium]